jgi:hypothetical protein
LQLSLSASYILGLKTENMGQHIKINNLHFTFHQALQTLSQSGIEGKMSHSTSGSFISSVYGRWKDGVEAGEP